MTDDPGDWDLADHDGDSTDPYGGEQLFGDQQDDYDYGYPDGAAVDDGYGQSELGPADPLSADDGGSADGATDDGPADRGAEAGGHDAAVGYDEPLGHATDHAPGLDGLFDLGDAAGTADGGAGADTALDHVADSGPADQARDTFGADLDADPYPAWPEPDFPAALDLGTPPEPVDGLPWTDPSTLGDAAQPLHAPTADADPTGGDGAPDPSDLADYAGLDPAAADWSSLAAADDPATAALARFWAPPSR
jgi:hypothetical protein